MAGRQRSRGPEGVYASTPRSGGMSSTPRSARHHPEVSEIAPPTTLSTHKKAPQFSMASRMKESSCMDVPGVGTYEGSVDVLARHTRVPKFSFGAATRTEPRKLRAPGPGAYVVPQFMGKAGPSFSLSPRRDVKSTGSKMPGPGAHEMQNFSRGASAPKPSIAPRREEPGVKEQAPGPGEYDTQLDSSVRPALPPSWGFGSARQRPRGAADFGDTTPGPGAYRHDSQLKGPQFSMRSRTAGAKERLAKF